MNMQQVKGTHETFRIPKGSVLNVVPSSETSIARVTSIAAGVGGPWRAAGQPISVGPFSKFVELTVDAPSGSAYVSVSVSPLPAASRLLTYSNGGDSFSAHDLQAILPTSTATCLSGIVTYPATNHGLLTGDIINVSGAAQDAANVVRAAVTRIDANNFSFPAPGHPDGPVASGVASLQVYGWSQQTGEGIFCHLQRKSRGAFKKVAMAGHSGYKMADYAARYDTVLAPFPSHLHTHWGYFNDLQFGVTVADSTAKVQETLLKRKGQGSLCAVISAIPIPSGVYAWPALTAPLVTLTDAAAVKWIAQWNRAMRDFCAANQMIYVDVFSQMADVTTGFALSGFNKSADIHPSVKSNRLAAKLLFAQLNASQYTPRLLTSSVLDNVSADSTSRNVCRTAPFASTTGGSANVGGGGTVTTVYTAWTTGEVVAAKRWRTNGGHLYYTAAGGTAGVTAPTHTTGSVSDGGVTWRYVMEATGTAGVPLGWTVASTGSPDAFSAIVPVTLADGSASMALRVAVIANAASDQMRISYNGTVADLTIGDVVDANSNVSLSTATNTAGNQTPAAQNVKAFTAQLVQIFDGTVTSIGYEARGGAGVVAEQQTEDIINEQSCVAAIPVYQGGVALTTLRHDHILQFFGAGMCTVDVGNLTLMH